MPDAKLMPKEVSDVMQPNGKSSRVILPSYYDNRHYWFKTDDFSTRENAVVQGQTYF